MKIYNAKNLIPLLVVIALVFSGCSSTARKQANQQFDAPSKTTEGPDRQVYSKALEAQNKGQLDAATTLWKEFLAKNPDSYEGHNNLGLVYYSQDMLTPALQEFETAYRLQPEDEIVRMNLARALEFKANLFHENREYDKTLEVLARLENIVPPQDKQGVLFKQEMVEDQIFIQVLKANNGEAYHDFIKRFPDGLNAVRAQAILDKNPDMKPTQVAKKGKKNKKSKKKTTGRKNVKSWLSSGKSVEEPSGAPEATTGGAPEEASATFTPPSATVQATNKNDKKVDIFGVDPAPAGEGIEEENIPVAQAEIPFEELGKPERTGTHTAPAVGQDTRQNVTATEPGRNDAMTTAGLDTSADLETTAKEEATPPPAQPEKAAAMPPVEPAPPAAAPAEEVVAEKEIQKAPPAAATPAVAGAEESEDERLARIIREEIAKEEAMAAASPSAAGDQGEKPAESAAPAAPAGDTFSTTIQPEVAEASPQPDMKTEEAAPAKDAAPVAEQAAPPTEMATADPAPLAEETLMAGKAETAVAPKDPSSTTMVVIKVSEGSTLNVRSKPSSLGEVLGYLENDDMMPLVSESGDWFEIQVEEGVTGWVSKKYSVTQDVPIEEASLELPEAEPEPSSDEELAALDDPSPFAKSEAVATKDVPAEEIPMVVINVREGSTLNVRSAPSASGEVIDMLIGGDTVPLVEKKSGWFQVKLSSGDTGWVSSKFSSVQGPSTVPEDMMAPTKTAKKEEASARSSADMTAPTKTAKKEAAPAPAAPAAPITTVIVIKVKSGSSLNVRSKPSSSGIVTGSMKSGDMAPLVKEAGDWYQIELPDGTSGWVSSKFSAKSDVASTFIPNP